MDGMIRAAWIAAGALLWLLGAVAGTRRSFRSGILLLIGCLGLGLACFFWGMLEGSASEAGRAVWTRLLWSTLTLMLPAWVAFSYRFGRASSAPRASSEKGALFTFCAAGIALTLAGLARPPVRLGLLGETREGMVLVAPWGRAIALYLLSGAILVFWNLHATLEAARAAGRKRVAECVYALIPVLVTAIYLVAEALLYGGQTLAKTRAFLPAVVISGLAFASALGRRRLEAGALPVGRPIVYSSVVLTAFGVFFVGLALLAQLLRLIGVSWDSRWYERAAVTVLLGSVLLWVFPGIRGSIRRFVDRNFYTSRFDYRTLWGKANEAFGSLSGPDDLPGALRDLFRSLFGSLHVVVWLSESSKSDFRVPGDGAIEALPLSHPIVRALRDRHEPLVLTGEAGSMDEIPLYAAGESLYQRHGLRIFYPIRRHESLVGILGCGPAGKRTLHPEDLDVIRTVSEHLGGVLAVREGDEARIGVV